MCSSASTTGQDSAYRTLMGLGGMCFLELDLFKKSIHNGPRGLFCDAFTTPKVVAACLDNNFENFLNPACYVGVNGKSQMWHSSYSCLDRMLTSTSCDFLRAWNPGLYFETWNFAVRHVPAMFRHLTRAGGITERLPTLHRRAERTRNYLRKHS